MVYLDHNATSPPHPRVLEEALPLLTEHWGNPSSSHSMARKPMAAVESARRRLAEWAGVRPRDVVLTGGATEANNLAVLGVEGVGRLYSAVEHPSVSAAGQARQGRAIPVTADGVVDLEALEALLSASSVAMVSVMTANNETGVLQPLSAIHALCQRHGALLHTDAAQAIGRIASPATWDLMTVTGHKAGGLKGGGALFVRPHVDVAPQALGGGQERGRRSGTTNPAPLVSLGVVATLSHGPEITARRDRLESACVELGGVVTGQAAPRLGNTCNVRFPGVPSAHVVMGLDLAGICVSAGSACHSGAAVASPVLQAMGITTADAIRFSLGWNTSDEDIDTALDALVRIVPAGRRLE